MPPTAIDIGVTFDFASESNVNGILRRIVKDTGPAGVVNNYLVETVWAGAGNELRTLWLTDSNNVLVK